MYDPLKALNLAPPVQEQDENKRVASPASKEPQDASKKAKLFMNLIDQILSKNDGPRSQEERVQTISRYIVEFA